MVLWFESSAVRKFDRSVIRWVEMTRGLINPSAGKLEALSCRLVLPLDDAPVRGAGCPTRNVSFLRSTPPSMHEAEKKRTTRRSPPALVGGCCCSREGSSRRRGREGRCFGFSAPSCSCFTIKKYQYPTGCIQNSSRMDRIPISCCFEYCAPFAGIPPCFLATSG